MSRGGDSADRRIGLTLVELMISLFVLALLAAGVVSAMIQLKWNAENNLYEVSSMNVAVSTLEQLKSVDYPSLGSPRTDADDNPVFKLFIDNGTAAEVRFGVRSPLDIPIVTNDDGEEQTLEVELLPQVQPCADFAGYWIEVGYRWRHPRTDKVFGGSVKSMRSIVSTF